MLPHGDAIDEGDLDAAPGLAVAFHSSIAAGFQAPEEARRVIVGIVERITGTERQH